MATQDQLHEAYAAFRIPVGSSWEVIKKRYKVLVKVWHPDRQGETVQSDAEQELKDMNHFYQDIFKPHFEGGEHREDRYCLCQSVPSSQSASQTQQQSEKEFVASGDSVFRTEEDFDTEDLVLLKRRKHASIVCAVAFAGLCIFSVFSNSIKSGFSNFKSSLPTTETVSETVTNYRAQPYIAAQSAPNTFRAGYVQSTQNADSKETTSSVSDDARRAITVNLGKMEMIKQDIETRKTQIRMANKESSGQLYRELGIKEEELRQLQVRTEQLSRGI